MRFFHRRREVPPEVQKAREALDEVDKAVADAHKAVQEYWTIQKQYAKAEAIRRRRQCSR